MRFRFPSSGAGAGVCLPGKLPGDTDAASPLAWRGPGAQRWPARLCPAPQTSLSPAPHPQGNRPDADLQGLQPQLTSPNLGLFHASQASSQALGDSKPFQRSFYLRVCPPANPPSALPHTATLPLPQDTLILKVKSTGQGPRGPAAKVAGAPGRGRDRR